MDSKDNFVLDSQWKDSDVLTFKIWIRGEMNAKPYLVCENTYKYRNFQANLKRNAESLLCQNLSKTMKDSRDSVNVGSDSWIEGIDCELLQDGIEKKGKIRLKVTLEFVPEETNTQEFNGFSNERSPLDEIRQINL